jgi:hypothetical protein
MDPDDGAPDDGLNLGADVDQYNVPAPVVLPASGSTTAAPVQAVVRVDGAGGSGGPSAPPPRRAPATHVDAVDADDVRDTTSQSASASPSAVAMPGVGLGRNGRETDAARRFSNRFGRTRSQTTREGVQQTEPDSPETW